MKLNIALKQDDGTFTPFRVEVVETRIIQNRHVFVYKTEACEYCITDTRTGGIIIMDIDLKLAWDIAKIRIKKANWREIDAKYPQINDL